MIEALTRHFGNRMPEVVVEPGRSLVGDAGIIQAEVVLISKKGYDDEQRWVYLDIGKFGGLIETMDEAIKYRVRTPYDDENVRTAPVVIAYASEVMARKSDVSTKRNSTAKMVK